MTALRFIHVIVATAWIIGGIISSNKYVNYYYDWNDHKVSHFIGTAFARITEGFCWWYLLNLLI